MVLWLAGFAAAAVVVYEGDVGRAVRSVAADAQVDVETLRPIRLDQLPTVGAPMIAGTPVQKCGAPPVTNAEIREGVGRAEGLVSYQRWPEAAALLDRAAESVVCLSEPAEASLVARLHFLEGYVAAALHDVKGATVAFARAHRWQPGLQWDARLPPDALSHFEAAAAVDGAPVRVPFGGDTVALWVDGRPGVVADGWLSLTPGVHLVQILAPSRVWTVELSAGPGTAIVTPEWLAGVAVSTLESVDQTLLASAFAALFPGDVAYVFTGARTWRVGDPWEELERRGTGAESICGQARRCVGHALAAGGGALAVAGGGAAVFASVSLAGSAESPAGESAEDYYQRLGRREVLGSVVTGGVAVGGIGLASLVTGLVLERPGLTFDGRHLGWTFRW